MAKKKKKDVIPQRSYSIYFIPIIIIVGFIIYSNTFHVPFLFDDTMILENQELQNGSIFAQLNAPRYVGLITFALNYQLNRFNTTGYHLVNLLIHIANALLVYLLTKKLIELKSLNGNSNYLLYVPILTALIFLVHPAQIQAVTYISQRITALAAFFTLASVILYIKFRIKESRSFGYLVLSLLCAVLAYKTKENTATLPVIIGIIEYIFFRASKINLKQKVLYILPYFLLLGVIIISFVHINASFEEVLTRMAEKSKETEMISRSQYLITEFRVVVTYIRLLLIPVNQCIDYFYPLAESFFEIRTLFSFLIVAGLCAVGFAGLKKHPLSSFGIFWFLNFLLIESSLIPIRDVIFEHRMYLPSVGFILALVSFLFIIVPDSFKRGLAIALLCIVIALSIATYNRNKVWGSAISLWEDAVKKYPQNLRNHVNLAVSYAEKERYDDAIKEFTIGLPKNTRDGEGSMQFARCYFKKGMVELGMEWIDRAVKLNPASLPILYGAATIYLEQNNYESALKTLNYAYNVNKSDMVINGLLGRTNCSIGNLDKALFFFDEAIRINSSFAEGYHDKGLCLFRNRKIIESRPSFLRCLEIEPTLTDSYYFIGVSYEMEKDITNAARYYEQAIARSPQGSIISVKAQERLSKLLSH